MRGDLLVQIRSKVGKGAVVGGLAALLFAGSIATAEFIDLGSFLAQGGEAKHLAPAEVNAQVVRGLLPGEKSDIKLQVTNPNSIPAWIGFRADSVQTVSGDSRCASEIVLAGGASDKWGGKAHYAAGETGTASLSDWVQLKWDAPDYCEGYQFSVKGTSHISAGGYRAG
jgi:hypothetical protein